MELEQELEDRNSVVDYRVSDELTWDSFYDKGLMPTIIEDVIAVDMFISLAIM